MQCDGRNSAFNPVVYPNENFGSTTCAYCPKHKNVMKLFCGVRPVKTTTEFEKRAEEAQNQWEPSTSKKRDKKSSNTCQIYLAESSISGAGLGVFAGVNISMRTMLGFPELAIPLEDMDLHNGYLNEVFDYHFLWQNYYWEGIDLGVLMEEEESTRMKETALCIPGLGAAPNYHPALVNAQEQNSGFDLAGLDNTLDPGAGAISPYPNLTTTALRDLPQGAEIFVNYGSGWFDGRPLCEHVPRKSNYERAANFTTNFHQWTNEKNITHELENALWKLITNLPLNLKMANALPRSIQDVRRAVNDGFESVLFQNTIRPLTWLQENGKCMDNIRPGLSDISQAGRGAFATRFLAEGEIVAPAPLIHIPYKDVLIINQVLDTPRGLVRNSSAPEGIQLLLNYCFGHRNSSMLLCPYGSATGFINHDSKEPNVKLQWSNWNKQEWLSLSVSSLLETDTVGLVLEFVATKNIELNDEILIDYGQEWEEEWNRYKKEWIRPANTIRTVKTVEEQRDDSSYEDVETLCRIFKGGRRREEYVSLYACDIIGRRHVKKEGLVYDVQIKDMIQKEEREEEDEFEHKLKSMSRSDIILRYHDGSKSKIKSRPFRHAMMIPDDIFPMAWMNRR